MEKLKSKYPIIVVKQFQFESAHHLPNYDGPCKNLHGHTYKVEIGFQNYVDPETGMVMDFKTIKKIVSDLVIDKLDHQYLNELNIDGNGYRFPEKLPTAENMVAWIVDILEDYINQKAGGTILALVRLWETSTSYAEWRRTCCL